MHGAPAYGSRQTAPDELSTQGIGRIPAPKPCVRVKRTDATQNKRSQPRGVGNNRSCPKPPRSCTLNAWRVDIACCGLQKLYPHAGRETKFFFEHGILSRPERTYGRFSTKVTVSLQRSRQTRGKSALNARGVKNKILVEFSERGAKINIAESGPQAKKIDFAHPKREKRIPKTALYRYVRFQQGRIPHATLEVLKKMLIVG